MPIIFLIFIHRIFQNHVFIHVDNCHYFAHVVGDICSRTVENPTRMKDDGMGGQVDILNTSYTDLPPKWQAENKAQAESAISLVAENMDNAMGNIDGLASEVHEQWLSRNSWAKDGPLGVPYSELPEEEKQKDRDVIIAAHEILSQMNFNQEETPEEMSEEMSEEMPEDDEY